MWEARFASDNILILNLKKRQAICGELEFLTIMNIKLPGRLPFVWERASRTILTQCCKRGMSIAWNQIF